jgi:hypothetical protein
MGFSISNIGSLLSVVGNVVSAIERFKGAKTGAEKKAAAIPLIFDSMALLEQLAAKDLVNDEALKALVGNLNDTIVKATNLERDIRARIAELKAVKGSGASI